MDVSMEKLLSFEGSFSASDYNKNLARHGLLPIGSAFYTSSGALANVGIHAIIHAASGSMSSDGPGLTPTIDSVANSVMNSLILAHRNGHKRVAVPFIGGQIFLYRIGVNPRNLATAVVRSAVENSGDLEVRMVAYSPEDTVLFKQVLAELQVEGRYAASVGRVTVVSGDITKFGTHGADVIVNAANTEGCFGGGVSGVIARATRCGEAINEEAHRTVTAFCKWYIDTVER